MNDRVFTQHLDDELRACYPPDGPIAAYMEWAHRTTHAPPLFHLGAILPILAEEATRRSYTIGGGHLNIWSLLIGPTAAGKSYCYKLARRFAADWWRGALGQFYEDPFISAEGSIPGVLEVLSHRYDELAGTTHGVLVLDEFSRVLQQENQSQALCMLFDGEDYVRNLRKLQIAKAKGERVSESIRSPSVSAVFAAPISVLERVATREHLEGGLMTRILFFRGSVSGAEMMLEPIPWPEDRIAVMACWQMWYANLEGLGIVNESRTIDINAPARAELMKLFEEYRTVFDYDDSRISGVVIRLVDYVKRIAALYALSRCKHTIDVPEVRMAVALARKCYTAIELVNERIGVADSVRLQWKILAFIRSAGDKGVRKTNLYREFQIPKRDLDESLATLVDGEYVLRQLVPTGERGRPPEYFTAMEFVKHS